MAMRTHELHSFGDASSAADGRAAWPASEHDQPPGAAHANPLQGKLEFFQKVMKPSVVMKAHELLTSQARPSRCHSMETLVYSRNSHVACVSDEECCNVTRLVLSVSV